jgi:hypothetical protein
VLPGWDAIRPVSRIMPAVWVLATTHPDRYPSDGRTYRTADHRSPSDRSETSRQAGPETTGRRLLEIVVYHKCCRIGGTLTLDDLAETSEVGDWKMPDFKTACVYAASQGWLIVEDNMLTLTTAGLAAA